MCELSASLCRFAAIFLAAMAATLSPAHAQGVFITFVSMAGSDTLNNATNNCNSSTTPCRLISHALTQTITGGTLIVLPGQYPGFTVSRAVNIIADQGQAGVSPNVLINGNVWTIAVSAPPDDVVRIRGLVVNANNDVANRGGIIFTSGAALHLEDMTVIGAGGNNVQSLSVTPGTPAGGGRPTELSVRNSVLGPSRRASGNVLIAPSGGVSVSAAFDHATIARAPYGIRADSTASGLIRVSVTNSVAKDHVNNGFIAVGDGASPVHFMIDRSTAHNNGAYGAVATGANAFMIAGTSTFTGNATGLAQLNGATVATYGDNRINFNTTNTAGTLTVIPSR